MAERFIADELTKLASLRDRGVITNEELAAQKRRLLDTSAVPLSGTSGLHGDQYGTAQPPVGLSTLPAGAWFAIIGGILAGIAALLPWLSASSVLGATITRDSFQLGSNFGFSIDGVLLVVAGALSIIIGIVRITGSQMPSYLQRSPIVMGAVITLIPLNRIISIHSLADKITHACSGTCVASIGIGMYICFAAGALAIIGGLVLRSSTSSRVY